jgi:parallel beta-helix repeat protein
VQHSNIHHNIGNPTDTLPENRGGGYGIYINDTPGGTVTFLDNEIARNGPEQKSINAGVVVWRNNFVHHNYWGGIWVDGDGAGSVIENNLVEDNPGPGIFWEGARQGIIRHNTVRRSGDQGIFISNSKQSEYYGNILENNFRGISVFVDCDVVGKYTWSADLADNNIHHNTIRTTGTGAYATGFNYASTCNSTELAPYKTNTKNNSFTANTYTVDNVSGLVWYWDGAKSWPQWQAIPQDATSTVAAN